VGDLTFNGLETSGATSPSSALPVAPGIARTTFSWRDQPVGGAAAIPVAQAQLQAFVFDFAAFSRVQTPTPAITSVTGQINLTGDFSTTQYLVEGVYQLEGTLTASNGSIIWSEYFYIHVEAPLHLTVLNLILVAIALWEIYAIAKLGSAPPTKPSAESSETKEAAGNQPTTPAPAPEEAK
jgi:hypothetical protein